VCLRAVVNYFDVISGSAPVTFEKMEESLRWKQEHILAEQISVPIARLSLPSARVCMRELDRAHVITLKPGFRPPVGILPSCCLEAVIVSTPLYNRWKAKMGGKKFKKNFGSLWKWIENAVKAMGGELKEIIIEVHDGQHRMVVVKELDDEIGGDRYKEIRVTLILCPEEEESFQHLLALGAVSNLLASKTKTIDFVQKWSLYRKMVATKPKRVRPAEKLRYMEACGLWGSSGTSVVNNFSSPFTWLTRSPEIFEMLDRLVRGDYQVRNSHGALVKAQPLKSLNSVARCSTVSHTLMKAWLTRTLAGEMDLDALKRNIQEYHLDNETRDDLARLLGFPNAKDDKELYTSSKDPKWYSDLQDWLNEKCLGQVNEEFFANIRRSRSYMKKSFQHSSRFHENVKVWKLMVEGKAPEKTEVEEKTNVRAV